MSIPTGTTGGRGHLTLNMEFDNSLYDIDAGYYEYLPGRWLPGTLIPDGALTWCKEAITDVCNLELNDSDVMIAAYPKTGTSERS